MEYERLFTEQSELDYYADLSDYPDSEGEGDDFNAVTTMEATYDSCVALDSLRQLLEIGGTVKDRTRYAGPVTVPAAGSGGGGYGTVVKSNGEVGAPRKQDLMDMSATAESLLPKSVIMSGSSGGGQSSLNGGLVRQLLHGSLLDFQLVALDWLVALHVQRLPAILADEPGLGRRVVVVAFIAHLVFQLCRPGPHLILCPLSAVPQWEAVLRAWLPALRVAVYGGSLAERRRMRRELAAAGSFSAAAADDKEGLAAPHLVLVSYAAFFSDVAWFVSRQWGQVVLAEVQNVVAAGTPAQVADLCQLRADNRLLIMSGPHKENPIDLWTCLRLLFPITHELHTGKIKKKHN
jgi:hypothetical protein